MRVFTSLIWGFAALCAAVAVPQKIHEQMSPDELAQVFPTINEDVPDYEITPIYWPKVKKRSADGRTGIYLKAFGEEIKLWLQPTDAVLVAYNTPVYLLKNGASGPQFSKYDKVMKELETFEDLQMSAAITVRHRRDNTRSIIGTIGSKDWVIAPIPERLVDEVRRQRRSLDEIPVSEQDDHHYHIVFKRSPIIEESRYSEERVLANTDKAKTSKPKSSPKPHTIYPEILVVVAHDLYKKLGSNLWDATAYVVTYWNGVDFKYRYFENPKIRLNIAGIVLTEDPEALEYMHENAFENDETTLVATALTASRTYWYARDADIPVRSYDVIITMTSNTLCQLDHKDNSTCWGGILGKAIVAGACQVNDYWKQCNNVAIVNDKSAFNGIQTSAHELGHLLGALHDGQQNKECSHKDGYIMAGALRLTDKSSEWSYCSLKNFQQFLDQDPVCLYNKPNQKYILPAYLPGRFMNANQQCEKLEGTRACAKDASICRVLKCIDIKEERHCKEMGSAAADGTECESGKFCFNGKCINA